MVMLAFLLPPLPAALAGWPAYTLFYLLGFGVAGGLLLRQGLRRYYPWRPWLLLVAGTVLAFVAGTRLIAGGAADWQAVLHHGHWGAGGPLGRSVLGGMAGAALALAGLRRLLGFGRDAADAFALPFTLGLAVQGVGCLYAGCCFGTVMGPHELGIGLRYGPGSLPFQAQVLRGWLPAAAGHSLPVHAAPLYQVLLCLGVAGALVLVRRALARRPGVALPLAFGLYAAGRFGLEFVRDPLGDLVGAGQWLDVKPVQWGLLGAALALGALAWWRSRQPASVLPAPPPADRPLPNLLLLLLLLLLPPVLLPGGFDGGETLVLRALLLPVLLLEAGRWLRVLRLARPLPAALLLLCAGLMSQAPAPTETPAAPALTFGLGGFTGSSYQLYQYPPTSCNSPQQDITNFPGYHQRYTGVSGSVAYSRPVGGNGRHRISVGLNGFLGRTAFDPPAARFGMVSPAGTMSVLEQADSRPLHDLNPNVEFLAPGGPQHPLHLRVGLGAHLGSQAAYDFPIEPLRSRGVVPSLVFEVGYRNYLWTHTSIYYGADAVGNGTWRLGLGTGFGQSSLTLLGGLATSNSSGQNRLKVDVLSNGPIYTAPAAGFAELRWQVSPTWQLEGSGLSNFNDVSRFSLGARYRLLLPGNGN